MGSKINLDTIKVERLNNVNFNIWKRRISYLLTHERTLYMIIKDKLTYVTKVTKWEEDFALAKAKIVNNMQDDLIPLYEGHDTAKEIMDLLENKYGPKFETLIQLYWQNLMALVCLKMIVWWSIL